MTAGGGGYGGGEICKGELKVVLMFYVRVCQPEGVLVLVMVVLMFCFAEEC